MKITGGRFRGRDIYCPSGSRIRPVLGRLRESVFSSLGSLEDMSVLDLFSGIGSLGIESISRGASFAAFVESDRLALRYLERNIHRLELEDETKIYPLDVYDYLSEIDRNRWAYQIAFIDPPYGRGDIERLAERLGTVLALADLIVVKHSAGEDTESFWRGIKPLRVLKRGSDRITILEGDV